MNKLILGTDKTELLHDLPDKFLIIDDGKLIDALPTFPKTFRVTRLDLSTHSLNPLKDIDYRRARQFISVLDAVFPEGENTLTKKASNFVLLTALLSHPTRLDRLIPRPHKTDTGAQDAYQKVQTLLLSPVLKRFLCHSTNFPLDGIILARLNRAELTDFDCFVIGNLLISTYQSPVVIPDFGFYACVFHTSLVRQNRLIAGINFLAEVPKLRNSLLTIPTKVGRHTTAEDAETLASYAGLSPGTNAYTDFIAKCLE